MLVFAACHWWSAGREAGLRYTMTIKFMLTVCSRSFHGASRGRKRLISFIMVSLTFIPWRRRTTQVWVCFIHLTFERIHCLLIFLRNTRSRQSWHRILVIWSISIWIWADCLSIQVCLWVFLIELQTLACIANSCWRICKNISCLLLSKALFVVFIFFLDLPMLLYQHAVISLLALT